MHLVEKIKIAQSFSRAAESYDAVAVLQKEVARGLLERLKIIRIQPKTILDVGSGTGMITHLLHEQYREASMFSTDIAYSMLSYASQRKSLSQQYFVCADASFLPFPDEHFDFVFSNLVLHWCSNFKQALQELLRVLKPQGLLLFSTLGTDTLKELRASWLQVDDRQHVHTFMDVHNIGDEVLRSGFIEPVLDVEHFVLRYADIYQLMRELKQLGAHNLSLDRHHGLTGKTSIRRLVEAYEAYRSAENKLPVTWEVIYGHAWKRELMPDGLHNRAAEVRIPIDQIMRR